MFKSIRSKQITLISAIVLIMAFLFSRDIKGLVKPKEEQSGFRKEAAADMISLEEVSQEAKRLLNTDLAKEVIDLEAKFEAADENGKADAALALARKWDDLEQSTPSALYLEIAAKKQPDLMSWVNAGERLLTAFDNSRDTIMQPVLLQKANNAFKEAMKIDSTSLDARSGLGITIVNGMGMPMQGIAMLMDVVKEDPKNLKANMSLATFAIKSGQFDKAISRFKDVVAIKPLPEAYFYMATAYENLGKNAEAIDAYQTSKKLAADPTLSKFIDERVQELKQK
ncbi:tetratricopeptide repeat protein [Pedobacter deserti]|uniref:tetratricopeptide repeat protein n=1 Tax=Pedobacter deserti TaxID=2817382 RepID=UPI00210AE4C1|nr:tetratricopeptide repeat protein [Pedobacter sp. SYSU D00382]